MTKKFIIEGLDRLGKSTLIQNIKNELGYYQVIHYQKPERLQFYNGNLEAYQKDSFHTMFNLLKSEAHLILDRAHLGEAVYAPLYRKYSGDYVFKFEVVHGINAVHNLRLIVLTEDFATSKHFVDDGESFDISKRAQEQEMFLQAAEKSIIADKKIICVTDRSTGQFRKQEDILAEAIAE